MKLSIEQIREVLIKLEQRELHIVHCVDYIMKEFEKVALEDKAQ